MARALLFLVLIACAPRPRVSPQLHPESPETSQQAESPDERWTRLAFEHADLVAFVTVLRTVSDEGIEAEVTGELRGYRAPQLLALFGDVRDMTPGTRWIVAVSRDNVVSYGRLLDRLPDTEEARQRAAALAAPGWRHAPYVMVVRVSTVQPALRFDVDEVLRGDDVPAQVVDYSDTSFGQTYRAWRTVAPGPDRYLLAAWTIGPGIRGEDLQPVDDAALETVRRELRRDEYDRLRAELSEGELAISRLGTAHAFNTAPVAGEGVVVASVFDPQGGCDPVPRYEVEVTWPLRGGGTVRGGGYCNAFAERGSRLLVAAGSDGTIGAQLPADKDNIAWVERWAAAPRPRFSARPAGETPEPEPRAGKRGGAALFEPDIPLSAARIEMSIPYFFEAGREWIRFEVVRREAHGDAHVLHCRRLGPERRPGPTEWTFAGHDLPWAEGTRLWGFAVGDLPQGTWVFVPSLFLPGDKDLQTVNTLVAQARRIKDRTR